jgi:hypothetical protein
MLSAARCAWLEFVAANRFEAALVPLAGFLVLILFLALQDRLPRVPRRIFQIAIAIFILGGVGAIIYETLSPQDCTAPSVESDLSRRFGL